MDTENRRRQLPALSWLDVDKVKREEEAYQTRPNGTPHNSSTHSAASPTSVYPSGPPPPYSHARDTPQAPTPTATWSAAAAPVHSPVEKRTHDGEEKDGHSVKPKQSLPSISEALGVDSKTAFVSTAASIPSIRASHLPPPPALSSPSPTIKRSYQLDPPRGPAPPSNVGGVSYPPYSQYRSEYQSQQHHAGHPESNPPMQHQSAAPGSNPEHTAAYTRPQDPPATHEPLPAHSAAPVRPAGLPYGYTSLPSQHTQTSAASGPIYQPSTVYGAPPTHSTGWRADKMRHDERYPGAPVHSESVKRHLDLYDLEVALNEIADLSPILTDFSRRYGDRMHQTQRSGAGLSMLPGIGEIDDMMHKSRLQLDALAKIRDVVLTQQAAYEAHAADQRQQQKAYEDAAASSTAPPTAEEGEDSKAGGLGGVDGTKKRRGRAAPPGRCHSCHRAETPEWRRGPDGARTLCNACGLHYAKLTRKQNNGNKAASIGSSTLRPKESAPP